MLHWGNLEPFLTAAAAGPKPVCVSFDRTNRCAPHTMQNSPRHLWKHKTAQPLDRLTTSQQNWVTNSEL
jgi:hypothetical protein